MTTALGQQRAKRARGIIRESERESNGASERKMEEMDRKMR